MLDQMGEAALAVLLHQRSGIDAHADRDLARRHAVLAHRIAHAVRQAAELPLIVMPRDRCPCRATDRPRSGCGLRSCRLRLRGKRQARARKAKRGNRRVESIEPHLVALAPPCQPIPFYRLYAGADLLRRRWECARPNSEWARREGRVRPRPMRLRTRQGLEDFKRMIAWIAVAGVSQARSGICRSSARSNSRPSAASSSQTRLRPAPRRSSATRAGTTATSPTRGRRTD
jgi:hypothetical protein